MKRLFTILLCAVVAVGMASGQYNKTINGLVVDKNGNPLVGAEVMAPGGGATAITDADGSFTMEVPILLKKLTASYTGMEDETRKLGKSSEMVFKMKPAKKMRGFLSIIGDVGFRYIHDKGRDNDYNYNYNNKRPFVSFGGGLMGGMLGNWGWYSKLLVTTDNELWGGYDFSLGAIKQIAKSSNYLYWGLGFGFEYDYKITYPSIDFGFIFKTSRHVNVITGLKYSNSLGSRNYDWGYREGKASLNDISLNIGVGYIF